MRSTAILAIGCLTLCAGCDLLKAPAAKTAPPTAANNPPPPTLPGSAGILPPGDLNEMAKPVAPAQPGAPAAQQQVAGVGVGVKGRSLEGPGVVKMIAEPAAALFRSKERIIFEIQIPKQLQTVEELEGRPIATHEEFMEKVIEPLQIRLPALPPGKRYVYDPTTKQLMVEGPAPTQ